jgi:acyl-CoA thioesterase
MEFTKHFKSMLKERSIQQQWVERAINEPEEVEEHEDGTRHFLRSMEEHGNRWLRVVINIQVQPNRAVTAFFDRRLRGRK